MADHPAIRRDESGQPYAVCQYCGAKFTGTSANSVLGKLRQHIGVCPVRKRATIKCAGFSFIVEGISGSKVWQALQVTAGQGSPERFQGLCIGLVLCRQITRYNVLASTPTMHGEARARV